MDTSCAQHSFIITPAAWLPQLTLWDPRTGSAHALKVLGAHLSVDAPSHVAAGLYTRWVPDGLASRAGGDCALVFAADAARPEALAALSQVGPHVPGGPMCGKEVSVGGVPG